LFSGKKYLYSFFFLLFSASLIKLLDNANNLDAWEYGEWLINYENGFIRRANYELGSNYGFYAKVISGSGRGKKLQYPTANLLPVEKDQLLPKIGVYLTRCIINGLSRYGMCNFGVRPTFEESELVLEVHLFDEKQNDLYGDCIWVEFLERVRDEKKFSSVEKLVEQLERDKTNCLSLKYKYELGEKDAYN